MDNKTTILLIIFLIIIITMLIYHNTQSDSSEDSINSDNSSIVPYEKQNNLQNIEHFDMNEKNSCKQVLDCSFEGGKHCKDYSFASGAGNIEIITQQNPGLTQYVLALGANEINFNEEKPCLISKYPINITIVPGKFYKMCCWVRDVKETSKTLFSIIFYSKCGKKYRLDTLGTNVVVSQNEAGTQSLSGWQKRCVIFQVPDTCKDKVTIIINYSPQKGIGTRYITGLKCSIYYPSLSCYPIPDILLFFLSIMHITNWSGGRQLWKDITGNGCDFHISRPVTSCNVGLPLNLVRYRGCCPCKLNINPLNWSLGFSVKFNSLDCKGVVLWRLDTSCENNYSILVIFKKDAVCCTYSQVVIKYLHLRYVFNIGYSNYLATYIVNCENGKISLFKDGIRVSQVKPTGPMTLNKASQNSFFVNKAMLLNPTKCECHAVIFTAFMHCRALTEIEVVQIYYYFTFLFGNYFDKKTYKCLINGVCKAPEDHLLDTFEFRPFTALDIVSPSNVQKIQEQKQQIKNKYDLEVSKYNEKICDAKLKHMEVTCEGDAVQHKSIQETQDLLQALVKAFNAKETDKNNVPCDKTSYRIAKSPNSKNNYEVIRTVQNNKKAQTTPPPQPPPPPQGGQFYPNGVQQPKC